MVVELQEQIQVDCLLFNEGLEMSTWRCWVDVTKDGKTQHLHDEVKAANEAQARRLMVNKHQGYNSQNGITIKITRCEKI